jgi:hypothetical protein
LAAPFIQVFVGRQTSKEAAEYHASFAGQFTKLKANKRQWHRAKKNASTSGAP